MTRRDMGGQGFVRESALQSVAEMPFDSEVEFT